MLRDDGLFLPLNYSVSWPVMTLRTIPLTEEFCCCGQLLDIDVGRSSKAVLIGFPLTFSDSCRAISGSRSCLKSVEGILKYQSLFGLSAHVCRRRIIDIREMLALSYFRVGKDPVYVPDQIVSFQCALYEPARAGGGRRDAYTCVTDRAEQLLCARLYLDFIVTELQTATKIQAVCNS